MSVHVMLGCCQIPIMLDSENPVGHPVGNLVAYPNFLHSGILDSTDCILQCAV